MIGVTRVTGLQGWWGRRGNVCDGKYLERDLWRKVWLSKNIWFVRSEKCGNLWHMNKGGGKREIKQYSDGPESAKSGSKIRLYSVFAIPGKLDMYLTFTQGTLLHSNRDVDNMKAESWNGFCKKLPCQCITMQWNAIHYKCNLGAAIIPPNFFTLNILKSYWMQGGGPS